MCEEYCNKFVPNTIYSRATWRFARQRCFRNRTIQQLNTMSVLRTTITYIIPIKNVKGMVRPQNENITANKSNGWTVYTAYMSTNIVTGMRQYLLLYLKLMKQLISSIESILFNTRSIPVRNVIRIFLKFETCVTITFKRGKIWDLLPPIRSTTVTLFLLISTSFPRIWDAGLFWHI